MKVMMKLVLMVPRPDRPSVLRQDKRTVILPVVAKFWCFYLTLGNEV